MGKSAQLPTREASNNRHSTSLLIYNLTGFGEIAAALLNCAKSDYPLTRTAAAWTSWRVPTWSYRYFGILPILHLLPWLVA
jgi:hypothetical protein